MKRKEEKAQKTKVKEFSQLPLWEKKWKKRKEKRNDGFQEIYSVLKRGEKR